MRALLIYPQFRLPSFWNLWETCKLTDARYPSPPLGLCTVAALLPPDWDLRLIDRNVEELDDSLLETADAVLISAMLPQQRDCVELIRKVRALGKMVIVGGPDPTASPEIYDEASHIVLGEAEVTLPLFLADLAAGTPKKIYVDERKANLETSPTPRFELLKMERYNHIGVQFCRGCPFNCEFCDIIELFGRVPRAKSHRQMLTELQKLYDLGYRGVVEMVDDNFIGNKKLVKQFLPELKAWQDEHNWPFEFCTEASINLADDAELLTAMEEVGFFAVFIGIESPDETTLIAIKKRQNTHRSIAASISKIYAHGIIVFAGFIIGFDTEKGSVAQSIIDCIESSNIPVNMAGLLFALPTTQLARRLAAEGRLHENFGVQPEGLSCHTTGGLNYDTKRPRLDILKDYLKVVETIYTPENYFNRVLRVGLELDSSKRRFKPGRRQSLVEAKAFWRLMLRLGISRATRRPFWRTLVHAAIKNPRSVRYTGLMLAMYLDLGPFAQYVSGKIRATIELEERNPSKATFAASPVMAKSESLPARYA